MSTLTAADLGITGRSPLLEKAARLHVHWIAAVTCRTVQVPDRRKHAPTSLTSTSYNWSGYEAATTSPTQAQAEWTVPNVSSDGYAAAFSSIWPGIGGDPTVSGGTGELIQAGTEEDASGSEEPNTYFWVEWYPGVAQIPQSNLIPNNTDSVGVSVSYAAGTSTFILCDFTQKKCLSGSKATAAPGGSAEVVVERTDISGYLPELADFRSLTITDALYDYKDSPEGTYYHTFSTGGTPVPMRDVKGTLLASVGALSAGGTQFTDTWHAFGVPSKA